MLLFALSFFIPQENNSGKTSTKNLNENQIRGKEYFNSYCSNCHNYSFIDKKFSEEMLHKILEEGLPNTSMPKFNYLPLDVKKDLVEFLMSRQTNSKEEQK